MGFIYIKRRREPIEVANDRAYRVKCRWLGIDDTPKAEPTEVLDLGEWAGEYSQIVSVEMSKEAPKPAKTYEEEEREKHAELMRTPVEERAKMLGAFKLGWFVRSHMTQKEPPATVMDVAERVALAYLKKNPRVAFATNDVFEPIFKQHFGKKAAPTLAEKMTIHTPEAKAN